MSESYSVIRFNYPTTSFLFKAFTITGTVPVLVRRDHHAQQMGESNMKVLFDEIPKWLAECAKGAIREWYNYSHTCPYGVYVKLVIDGEYSLYAHTTLERYNTEKLFQRNVSKASLLRLVGSRNAKRIGDSLIRGAIRRKIQMVIMHSPFLLYNRFKERILSFNAFFKLYKNEDCMRCGDVFLESQKFTKRLIDRSDFQKLITMRFQQNARKRFACEAVNEDDASDVASKEEHDAEEHEGVSDANASDDEERDAEADDEECEQYVCEPFTMEQDTSDIDFFRTHDVFEIF